jgi:hypothetical protein
MFILRIDHAVSDYDGWKAIFDSDPVDRQRSGVRRYRVMRGVDDPSHVSIDLEFETSGEAEVMLSALREVWDRVSGTVISDPQARIVEVAETREF